MTDTASNNKRIAKNTLLLYFRMILTMLVTLYTSRVVLNTLGVEDFGIYNIVGGVVVLFGFINSAMTSATQRFLNFAMGKEDESLLKKTFSISLTSHVVIAFLLLVLSETVGLWFLNTYIDIPSDRMYAANWVYQFSVFTLCTNFIRVPYNATIIANERMSFFAYISILEVSLKLAVVYLLFISSFDKLIFYSGLIFGVSIIVLFIYIAFCLKNYESCYFEKQKDIDSYKELFSFSSWSLLGGVASTGVQHGNSILLNLFFGVVINASVGIANQISFAIYTFASNFQIAFTPQLTKYYAQNKLNELYGLIYSSSKYSYFLYLLVAFPVFVFTDSILLLWLGEVPPSAAEFSKYILIYLGIETLSAPLWITTQATGRIKHYQIIISLLIVLNLPISYILLKTGYSASVVYMVRVVLSCISLLYRIINLINLIGLSLKEYTYKVLTPTVFVSLFCMLWYLLLMKYINTQSITDLILGVCATELFLVLLLYKLGLNAKERKKIVLLIDKVWQKVNS